jgi:hypothetical protein
VGGTRFGKSYMKVRSISRNVRSSPASTSVISGSSCVASFPFVRMRSTKLGLLAVRTLPLLGNQRSR